MDIQIGEIKLKLARCEGCGGDAVYLDFPAGWCQTGDSNYGNKYDPDGLAWWCVHCSHLTSEGK